MRIPANKRHLIVNKEYSRLPYFTDDGYEEVQTSTSQKYIQDTYGKFAESENQQPYKGDEDYQGLEYNYSTPQFPDNDSDVPIINTKPSGFCEGLWEKLFGSNKGVFVPNAAEWNALAEYAKKCPLIYLPHICCTGGLKISGPATVSVNGEASFTVTGGNSGCAYELDAKYGEFIGTKYFAPSTSCTDTITITPWMSDDSGRDCATTTIVVGASTCLGIISYTTNQMAVSQTQSLSVTTSAPGDVYTWTTTSGSVSPSTGTSTTFTAPSSNANCSNNPTITLSCNGTVVDTLEIAVYGTTGNAGWYATRTTTCSISGSPPFVLYQAHTDCLRSAVSCAGVLTNSGTGTGDNGEFNTSCTNPEAVAEAQCLAYIGVASYDTFIDIRTVEQKAAGCCPWQAL